MSEKAKYRYKLCERACRGDMSASLSSQARGSLVGTQLISRAEVDDLRECVQSLRVAAAQDPVEFARWIRRVLGSYVVSNLMH